MKHTINLICVLMLFFGMIACDEQVVTPPEEIIPAEHIPYIEAVSANPQEICLNEESLIKCIATDSQNDIMLYLWEVTSGHIKNIGGYEVVYQPGDPGIGLVSCQVQDRAINFSAKKNTDINVLNCYAAKPRLAVQVNGRWRIQ